MINQLTVLLIYSLLASKQPLLLIKSLPLYEISIVIIYILQMMKWNTERLIYFAQDHIVIKWLSQYIDLGILAPESAILLL